MLAVNQTKQIQSNQIPAYRYKRIKNYVYDLEAILGKGNFSTVYQATNENTNQQIAVKVVKLSSLTFKKLEELLEQEIAIIRSMNHPNVIRCYEVLKSCNHCYFITQLCEQGSLQKTLKQKGFFNQEEIWPIVRDIFQGLKYLTSKGIIHRDLKTANIFIKNNVAKIADFGFAIHSKSNFQDFNIGSPLYMSPEGYIHNIYGPKTDVWAFGVVLYELLHGRVPLLDCVSEAELKNSMVTNITDEQFKPEISAQLKHLIRYCLQVDQKHRISIEDIQKTAYMQKHMSHTRNFGELKVNWVDERRGSVPLLFKNSSQIPHSLTSTNLNAKQLNKQNSHNSKSQNRIVSQRSYQLQVPKHEERRQSDIQQNRSILVECGEKQLVLGKVTFNQCIGLIHFCRIGFKVVQQTVGQEFNGLITSLVLKLLHQLLIKIDLGLIVYDVKQNRQNKQLKLKTVVREYLAKYSQNMKKGTITVNTNKLHQLADQHLANTEINQSNIHQTYLAMLFTTFTSYLMWAITTKDYSIFGQNGVVDLCLQEQSIPKTQGDYLQTKRKYLKLHPSTKMCLLPLIS